jgi:hypothetical protein
VQAAKSGDDRVGQSLLGRHWSLRMAEVPLACNLRSIEPS